MQKYNATYTRAHTINNVANMNFKHFGESPGPKDSSRMQREIILEGVTYRGKITVQLS